MTEAERFELYDEIEKNLLTSLAVFTKSPNEHDLEIVEKVAKIYLAMFDTPAFARREAKWGSQQGLVDAPADDEELDDLIENEEGEIPF